MYPLIEIQTIPIEIQMKVTDALLEYARGTAQMEVSRDKGGLQIRSQPIRVNIDTFEARSSVMPTTAQNIQQGAQKGMQAAYQATGILAREGRMMMEAKIGGERHPRAGPSSYFAAAGSAECTVFAFGGPGYFLGRRGDEYPL